MIPMLIRRAAGASFSFEPSYLDSISPSPRAAYSLKKVVSTASLSVRVRRSNDNAEQDIGFSGGTIDAVALSAFVGANSAFVTVFYDQTAAGVNMIQPTASAQPRIMNAGVFDGSLVFDGVNDAMSSVSNVSFSTAYASAYMKAAIQNQAAAGIILESSTNYNSSVGSFIWYMENSLHSVGLNGGASYRRDFSISNSTSLRNLTARYQMATPDSTIAQQRFRASGVDIGSLTSVGSAATPPVKLHGANALSRG